MTSGQYSFYLLLNADWFIQISEGLAVCKELANQNSTTAGWGGVVNLHVGFLTIANSASHSSLYFFWPVAKEDLRKLSWRCVTSLFTDIYFSPKISRMSNCPIPTFLRSRSISRCFCFHSCSRPAEIEGRWTSYHKLMKLTLSKWQR